MIAPPPPKKSRPPKGATQNYDTYNIRPDVNISVVASATSTICQDMMLPDALDKIRSGWIADQVKQIRSADADTRKKLKADLPAMIPAGTFSTRRADALEKASGLLVIDLDNLPDAEGTRDRLGNDPHVRCAFVSPSGNGVKLLMPTGGRDHLEAFLDAESYLKQEHNLPADRSGKDICRICFFSHDPNLKENTQAKPTPKRPKEAQKKTEAQRNDQVSADEIRDALSCIPSRPEYADWLRICSAVWSVLPMDEANSILESWSPEESPSEYPKKWQHRLQNVGIGTLFHFAKQHGYKPKRKPPSVVQIAHAVRTNQGSSKAAFDIEKAIDSYYRDNHKLVRKAASEGEAGAAMIFAQLFADRYLFDATNQVWNIYENGKWVTDLTTRSRLELRLALQKLFFMEAERVETDLKEIIEKENLDPAEVRKHPLQQVLKNIYKSVAQLNQRRPQDNALHLSRDFFGIEADVFDADPDRINLLNGTLNLKNFTLAKHDPGDRLRKQARIHYDPNADCPKFKQFMRAITCDDAELAAFLRRALGLALTGSVDHDYVVFCIGEGSNGKSTLFDVVRTLLADYFTPLPVEAILTQRGAGRDAVGEYERVNLFRARMALCSEIPNDRRLNESLIKDLVGGDMVNARNPYGRPFSFVPTHKLFVFGNVKPEVRGTDSGIWRRVHIAPFNHAFPKSGEEGNIPREQVTKELIEEAPGILNWLIEGLKDIRKNGLNPPLAVRAATDAYKSESDKLAQFIDERCEISPGSQIGVTEFYRAFTEYCQESGERRPQTKNAIGRAMTQKGFESRRGTGGKWIYEGITTNSN